MEFQDRAKQHLSEYKLHKLGVTENGCWKRKNKEYTHILPFEYKQLNFLENYRTELSGYIEDTHMHLHQDFHHLNSSQAACLNFFYPLVEEDCFSKLLPILQFDNETIKNYQFEKIVSRKEGTNFDFYLELDSGKKVFFEIKYSEIGFGKATDLPRYREKYESVYKARLEDKVNEGILLYPTLIKNYQLMRNISYVDPTSFLVIICPEGNRRVRQEYENVIYKILKPEYHSNIQLITWEALVHELKSNLHQKRLNEHYTMFEEKYLLMK
ncbi:hypothetical protein V7114_14965 [Neobacillus niacini]|uniref:PGN_0703 family putative restriction endonuclease n=1 Tax=Neobacillus niacini TaxID=86668 RepID=UPI002FFF1141